jgi:hypothetical protein
VNRYIFNLPNISYIILARIHLVIDIVGRHPGFADEMLAGDD